MHVFSCRYIILNWLIHYETKKIDEENCTICDYAVQVDGLPADANDEEVMIFFSDLYQVRVMIMNACKIISHLTDFVLNN